MRGLVMMMVMLERSDIQVAHIGRYSMTERGACQEGKADDCDFDEVALYASYKVLIPQGGFTAYALYKP